jgi:hypothetical protein
MAIGVKVTAGGQAAETAPVEQQTVAG